MSTATSTRPYLIRAIYEWAVDNGLTPHLLVDAGAEGVNVPSAHVRDGKIALNIHPQAVHALELGKEYLLFSARFSGQSFDVVVPVGAVLAIFARENGHGFFFQEESPGDGPSPDGSPQVTPPSGKPGGRKGPALKVVK